MYMRYVQNQNKQSLISCFWHLPRVFSFKNNRLIDFTVSLSCRSGRAQRNPTRLIHVGFRCALPIGVNLSKRLCFYECFLTLMVIETVHI